MPRLIAMLTLVAVALWFAPAGSARAAEDDESKMIGIQVTDMHCVECAKKIAGKLYGVPGVVRVKAKLDVHTAYVVPQQSKGPSPKALWEAVENAGFKVVKISGPNGTYSAKPNF